MTAFEETVAHALGLQPDELPDDAGPATVGAWTSLRHVQIIAAVQRLYGVRFAPREARSIRTVGDLRRALRDKGVAL
jgi:acyl carrier protein